MNYEDLIQSYYEPDDNFVASKPKIKKDRYDDFERDNFEYDRKYCD